jgi:ADP-heptose:LPS heptosyltransferase
MTGALVVQPSRLPAGLTAHAAPASLPATSPAAAQGATCPGIGYGTLPVRRILVVQTQRLGDVLCATPVFAALRRRFPEAHLAAMVHRPLDNLLEGSPDLDDVLTYDRQSTERSLLARLRLIGELRERAYDWALSIHAASSVAFAMWQAAIPWRTCVWRYGSARKPHWAWTYHGNVRQERHRGERHEIEYNLDVLREIGLDTPALGYRLELRPDELREAERLLGERGLAPGEPLAVVHPGHGGGRQSWPPESYAAVADGLIDRGLRVAVTGSAAEGPLVARVVGAMRRPAIDLAGAVSIRGLAGVLARARLFVSVSTGPLHLAGAMRVPCVTLYGPSDLRAEVTRFCAYGVPRRAVLSPVACPCPSSKTCTNAVCMTGIGAEAVLSAADELLAEVGRGPVSEVASCA